MRLRWKRNMTVSDYYYVKGGFSIEISCLFLINGAFSPDAEL